MVRGENSLTTDFHGLGSKDGYDFFGFEVGIMSTADYADWRRFFEGRIFILTTDYTDYHG